MMAGFVGGIAAGVKNGNGKRERVDQEDDQEFMPLSKRINNIHLSPERMVNGAGSSMYMHSNGIPQAAPHHSHSLSNGFGESSSRHHSSNYGVHSNGYSENGGVNVNDFNDGSRDGGGSVHSSSSGENNLNFHSATVDDIPGNSIRAQDLIRNDDFDSFHYRPSLNESANPHYYEANRTLFELYIERQMRTNQVPHPNVYGAPSSNGGN